MNLLEDGANWLEGQRDTHLTTTVNYQRGAANSDFPATIGKTVFEVFGHAGGIRERVESRDYLIMVDSFEVAFGNVKPARGDKIVETVGTKTFTYEVIAPNGEPHWRYSDPFRITYRIHTKLIKEVTA